MEDFRVTLNAVGWALACLSTLFIVARLYTRICISESQPGKDDWFMLVAWIFAIVCTSLVTVGTTYGFGQHIADIPVRSDRESAAMYVIIAPIFSLASAFFTKTSIIIAFMRIMGRTVTWVHRLVAYVPIVLLLLLTLLACGVVIFLCTPLEKIWRPYIPGKCMDPKVLDYVGRGVSAYNALMDFFCAAVPYFLIRRLNIHRREKRNLILLMGGSIFGAIATIMKIVAMSTISQVEDITYAWIQITIWYLAENHILIIAGSMPALRPFWWKLRNKYNSYKSSYYAKAASESSFRPWPSNAPWSTMGSMGWKSRKGSTLSQSFWPGASQESLELGPRSKTPRCADTESIEAILPRPQGMSRACVSGPSREKGKILEEGSRLSFGKIAVTTEVEVV